jgi:hypothetical protein
MGRACLDRRNPRSKLFEGIRLAVAEHRRHAAMWRPSRHATGVVHETVSGPVGRVGMVIEGLLGTRSTIAEEEYCGTSQHQVVAKRLFFFYLAAGVSAWGSECYELSIHVMQAGKSNWVLEISMGPLLSRSQGFPFTTCREGNTGSRRGFV